MSKYSRSDLAAILATPGAKSRGIVLPMPDLGPRLPTGRLVAAFDVVGRPIPWSVSRPGTKNPALTSWQQLIAWHASRSMERKIPYGHPVELKLRFLFAADGRTQGDLTNLQKAAEDALQGSAIINDKQVVAIEATKAISKAEGVLIRVWAADDSPEYDD